MTYRDLLEFLNNLDDSQLDQDVLIRNVDNDAFHWAESLETFDDKDPFAAPVEYGHIMINA